MISQMMGWRVALFCWALIPLLCMTNSLVNGQRYQNDKSKPKRCVPSSVHGKVTEDCFDMKLTTVPTNLRSDIQVLELSFNRIRELLSGVFSRYSYMEILYLGDNAISHIDEDVFEPLQRLQVIDLSLNSIHTVPGSLLAISTLWKLDISRNPLSVSGLSVFSSTNLGGNLKWLSLAQCHLTELPQLCAFPQLMILNVSGNALNGLNSSQLACLCSLTTLDFGSTHKLLTSCDCHTVRQWLSEDAVQVFPAGTPNCSTVVETKPNSECNMQEAEAIRMQCREIVTALEHKAKVNRTLTIVGAVVATVVGVSLLLLLLWLRRRRRARRRRRIANNNININGIEKPTLDSSQNKLLKDFDPTTTVKS